VKLGHFPAPRELGTGKRRGRIGWIASEVEDWIQSRPKRIPKGFKGSRSKEAA
jgi:predicted DNA-binding transcriptional regulator AlpA